MQKYRILIAGAGLGGLTAASCLMKAGHTVEVYEQAPQLGEVGAGIQVSANAMHVMRHLGLEDALLSVGVKPEAYVFRLHDTGEVIQRVRINANPFSAEFAAAGSNRIDIITKPGSGQYHGDARLFPVRRSRRRRRRPLLHRPPL